MDGTEEEGKKSLRLNVEETTCCGSDSGVDVTPAASCDSSLASGCYDPCKSPVGPFSPTGAGPSSLPCYTAGGYSRPSTPTWRRPAKLPNSMSSSFHFESSNGNRNSPPRTADGSASRKPDLNAVAKQAKISTVKKLVNTYDMVKSLDRYATLPRRKRRSKENLTTAVSPAATPPKEPSLNRAASLRRKHIEQGAAMQATHHGSSTPSPLKSSTMPKTARPPPPPTTPVKTKIYHEVCSQTCLTGEDITSVLAGNVLAPVENRVETNDAEVQVDLVAKRINALETDLKEKTEQLDCKIKEFTEQQECLKQLQERLNQEDSDSCKQVDAYSLRLCNIFQINDCIDPSPSNILDILEKYVTSTSCTIGDQQKEISNLKTLCTSLHRDLEKSYAAQKSLLQANQAAEMESYEIQDFLQAEKAMLLDTIKDLEKDVKDSKEQLSAKEKEAAKLKEQCTHLVRISEQRRQENLSLQAKMHVLENKSREVLQQQESTVSSAVVGLSGLGNRLDSLLDKLIKSYSISEIDIEDEVYFNEAYTNGDSGSESEQHHSSSNKTDSKSLLSAIVSAIKSAPVGWQKAKMDKALTSSTNSQELFHSPVKRLHTSASLKELQKADCQFFKQNGSTGDLISQTDSLDDCSELQSAESESLNNLSDAIIARQQLEMNVNCGVGGLEFLEDFRPPDADLLDQVIDLDNTVTRLLKVLTIAQGNNKEQLQRQERPETKYNNCIGNGKSRQYLSQPSLIHENDEANCKRTPLVPVQELNTSSHKTLNGFM
ncbi:uncharacterized protein LOC126837911 [Adelges cooleyi]|uniref:uncharacterized protein LOC126837911 n=1 Tax=Adelges cooleyi TaxID=133065 RepID=UPI00217F4F6E|nr:uncharacterized protein LOC126837911 [Adelges cooleyi]